MASNARDDLNDPSLGEAAAGVARLRQQIPAVLRTGVTEKQDQAAAERVLSLAAWDE